ncbi:MAG: hypothetical protein LBE36_00335 [Flavobacteriaceae bacterium]|jgi:hypothetical protein|nr:hypothetical protein [Flavobacteriaceae bacterium]
MKKIILISAFVFCGVFANAQQKNYVYCEITRSTQLFSSKINIIADFGKEKEDYLKDENGNRMKFNSMADAMNFMGTQGWEFVQAYVITTSDDRSSHRWILKKEINSEEANVLKESFKEN